MPLGQNFAWGVTHFPYPNGHLVILGPYNSVDECRSALYLELEDPFDVVELATKDRGRATAILKKRDLSNTSDLGRSLQRAGHQPPKSDTTPDISPNDPLSPY